jgi:uncharacterized protein (TIGR02147 family)
MKPLFESLDYRRYLSAHLELLSETTRGVKSRFAEALQCRPGFISQILSGAMSLSADQAAFASEFLGHTDDEAEFFLLLVLHDRAAAPALKIRLTKQLAERRARFLDLKARLNVEKKVSKEDELVFYSSWTYLAILTLVTIPEFQTKEAIAAKLELPLKNISESLEYLLNLGIVRLKAGRYLPGETRTHLEKSSPMIARHHQNWRIKAMQSIEKANADDFHYSSVISISREDRDHLRALIISFIDSASKVIAPSKEEEAHSLSIDFFEL